MRFVEFFIVAVILIVICLLEIKLLLLKTNMPRQRVARAARPRPRQPRRDGIPGNPTINASFTNIVEADRLRMVPEGLELTQREVGANVGKKLSLPFPEENGNFGINFGTIYLPNRSVNLAGESAQKIGNWAEYLFQNVARGDADDVPLGQKSSPLVEGTSLDGTFNVQRPVWSKYGVISGRTYEIKSTVDSDSSFTFKEDNLQAVIRTNGFLIMCQTDMHRDGTSFRYRGYTYQDVIEMGLPYNNPTPAQVNHAKIVLSYWLAYGETPVNPTFMKPRNIEVGFYDPEGNLMNFMIPNQGGIYPDYV